MAELPQGLILNPDSPKLMEDRVSDMPFGESPMLDEEDVMRCVQEDFANDVKDKEDYGWLEKREWDFKSYYMVKDYAMTQRPWPGASAYPVPIIPALLDTGKANLQASKQSEDGRWVGVKGVGEEDIRKANPLEALLNWQCVNQIPMEEVEDITDFRMLLNGDGLQKVIQDHIHNRVKLINFDAENFYIPIDADGVQFPDNHGRCTQIIPLTWNDVQVRKMWGIKIYQLHPVVNDPE